MINDVFIEIENGMGILLFADDGEIWKRERNLEFIVKKPQGAIKKVEEWSYNGVLNFQLTRKR